MNFILQLFGATALLSLPPYLIGYSYLYTYFRSFGVSLSETSIDYLDFLATSMAPLRQFLDDLTLHPLVLVGGALLAVPALLILWFVGKEGRTRFAGKFKDFAAKLNAPHLQSGVLVVLFAGTLVAALSIGTHYGRVMADAHFQDPGSRPSVLAGSFGDTGNLREGAEISDLILNRWPSDNLIFADQETLFLLRRATSAHGQALLIRLPRSELDFYITTFPPRTQTQ